MSGRHPFSDYEAYLQSPEWQQRRKAALERAEYRCQICNSPQRLDAHHRTYERLGNEEPADLTVLCRACHDTFHDRIPQPPGSWVPRDPDRRVRESLQSATAEERERLDELGQEIRAARGDRDRARALFDEHVALTRSIKKRGRR